MYLEHFKLQKHPFSLTPNTAFYCELPSHQEALNILKLSLSTGEGFIKIVGEVGTGKTLLCRLLLNTLDDNYVTAYIPNPDLSADSLRLSVAKELGINITEGIPKHTLIDKINQQLLTFHREGKRVVLLIDEAQVLSEACLEAVRLLTNLETEEDKLLQVVLFAQPELDTKLDEMALRQLKQRITFSYYLKPLKTTEMDSYLCHRLAKAGYTYGALFTKSAKRLLYRASGGLPRLLNVLCHKGLLVAYGKGAPNVGRKAILKAIADTESVNLKKMNSTPIMVMLTVMALAIVFYIYWKLGIFS
jgi:MSHA biogenesis protein MshM